MVLLKEYLKGSGCLDRTILSKLPTSPGVYIFKDEEGHILYVGKAKNLKRRIRSYFSNRANLIPRISVLVSKIHNLDYIITDDEIEAFILESNLIKRYRPRYNIRLKDDKKYPYLKITYSEKYPRIFITRDLRKREGDVIYGPFINVKALKTTVEIMKELYPIRECKYALPHKAPKKPCLNYHIKRCLAPCQGYVSEEVYKEIVKEAEKIISITRRELVKLLQDKMWYFSDKLQFEKAKKIRDWLIAIENSISSMNIESATGGNKDIISIAMIDGIAEVSVLEIRNGSLVGRQKGSIEGVYGKSEGEILYDFIKSYYANNPFTPNLIIIPTMIREKKNIEEWLSRVNDFKVSIVVDKESKLMKIAKMNAELSLKEKKKYEEEKEYIKAIEEIGKYVKIKRRNGIAVCIDISNIMGSYAVASVVAFKYGTPYKKLYRRYKIKTVEGINDLAMIGEVVERFIWRLKKKDYPMVDFILIDGGKGQLSYAYTSLKKSGLDIPIFSIAKKEEAIYTIGIEDRLDIDKDSVAGKLFRRLRDEAHRFAITYHRLLRSKEEFMPLLMKIPGIGTKKLLSLLERFNTIDELKKASIKELANIKGIDKKTATYIYHFFQEQQCS